MATMTEPRPLIRCSWANPSNPLYLRYHDEEWGVPCTDETRLFEMLNLEVCAGRTVVVHHPSRSARTIASPSRVGTPRRSHATVTRRSSD